MEVEDASRVSNGGGVRLSVPGESLRGKIGPITVQEMAEVVDGSDDSDFVLLRSVHCLPSPCDFLKPLTLDFNVREGRVRWWWDRAAVREEVLRDYQVWNWWGQFLCRVGSSDCNVICEILFHPV